MSDLAVSIDWNQIVKVLIFGYYCGLKDSKKGVIQV